MEITTPPLAGAGAVGRHGRDIAGRSTGDRLVHRRRHGHTPGMADHLKCRRLSSGWSCDASRTPTSRYGGLDAWPRTAGHRPDSRARRPRGHVAARARPSPRPMADQLAVDQLGRRRGHGHPQPPSRSLWSRPRGHMTGQIAVAIGVCHRSMATASAFPGRSPLTATPNGCGSRTHGPAAISTRTTSATSVLRHRVRSSHRRRCSATVKSLELPSAAMSPPATVPTEVGTARRQSVST